MSTSDLSTQAGLDTHSLEYRDKSTVIDGGKGVLTPDAASTHSEKGAATPYVADQPPDGGFKAWMQVFAVWFLFFNPWGMVNTFGAFQTYYDGTLGESDSNVSWIGTFQGFLLLFVGALSGPLYDKGYLHHLIGTGTFLMTFGMMMTSLSTKYYQAFLAQGVCIGLGAGCLFVPSLSVLVQWFGRKRPLATGIVTTGGSIGATLFPIIFRRLQPSVGFGWACRVIGFIVLATLAFSLSTVRRRVPANGQARALIDPGALRSSAFWATTFSIFFPFMGVYVPFFYISSWSQEAVGASEDLAFYLLAIMNAGSLFGRLAGGYSAVRVGSINMLFVFVVVTTILGFLWTTVSTIKTTIVFCVFYGFFSGAVVSLPYTVIANITPDPQKTGTWMGMVFGISSFGLLIGNPIAGAILKSMDGDYLGAQLFGGACVLVGVFSTGFLRLREFKRGKGWNQAA